MPKVSVIVPNYNHAHFLRRRMDSIFGQTFQDFEVILLDDCSTDESRAVLSSYANDPRVKLAFNDVNSGSTFKQWNKGAQLARGEYIWFAESDDYADPRLLERLTASLDRDPGVAFAYCRSRRVYEDGRQDGFADYYLEHLDAHRWTADYCADGHEECKNYFVLANPVPNASAVVFRRGLYEAVGGADESLCVCGDWKLWVAMALTGSVSYIGEPLNYFRSHEASVRNKTERTSVDVAENLRVVRWILSQVTPEASVLDRLYKAESARWVPVLMSRKIPHELKREIAIQVRAIDPHPIRSAIRPALSTLGKALSRRWRDLSAK